MKKLLVASAVAALTVSGAAIAQERVFASADLNVRAGPGTNHRVIGMIGANDAAEVWDCSANGRWCRISYRGGEGWVSAGYLEQGRYGGPGFRSNAGAATGAATGAIAGAIVGGPIGAVVGGMAGTAIGTGADVATESRVDRMAVGSTVPDFVPRSMLPRYSSDRAPEFSVVHYRGLDLRVETETGRVVDVLR